MVTTLENLIRISKYSEILICLWLKIREFAHASGDRIQNNVSGKYL